MSATPAGTQSYFKTRALPVAPTRLGRTGFFVSPVGFGGYRIQDGQSEHAEALKTALLSGCNLVDTSTNYGDGRSERLLGQVLGELFSEGRLQPDQIVVVSKAGYVQGENLRLARERKNRGMPFPEMTEYSSECWHCISPEFLKDQITRSLARLGRPQLDVLLLHNPEYFLKAGGTHEQYYVRIEAAFRYLESEVALGRIQYYGISSNTFPEPREAPDYTSLEVVTEIAEKISPDHHFAVIQFPMNLFEPGAALEENNSGKTVAEFARSKDLGTLVNRPLNAFVDQSLVRLADFPNHGTQDIVGNFKAAMNQTTALEAQFSGRDLVQARDVAWGHMIRENFSKLADIDTWRGFRQYRIEPTLESALQTLSKHPDYSEWASRYRVASQSLFEAVTDYLEEQASVISDKIAGQLDHLCPAISDTPTLSQKVIRLYRSVPGIDCILVGMRQNRYVHDALAMKPPVSWDAARRTLVEFEKEVIFK